MRKAFLSHLNILGSSLSLLYRNNLFLNTQHHNNLLIACFAKWALCACSLKLCAGTPYSQFPNKLKAFEESTHSYYIKTVNSTRYERKQRCNHLLCRDLLPVRLKRRPLLVFQRVLDIPASVPTNAHSLTVRQQASKINEGSLFPQKCSTGPFGDLIINLSKQCICCAHVSVCLCECVRLAACILPSSSFSLSSVWALRFLFYFSASLCLSAAPSGK